MLPRFGWNDVEAKVAVAKEVPVAGIDKIVVMDMEQNYLHSTDMVTALLIRSRADYHHVSVNVWMNMKSSSSQLTPNCELRGSVLFQLLLKDPEDWN